MHQTLAPVAHHFAQSKFSRKWDYQAEEGVLRVHGHFPRAMDNEHLMTPFSGGIRAPKFGKALGYHSTSACLRPPEGPSPSKGT